MTAPRRMLMTLDAVGGVWRHAVDLARALSAHGSEVVLAGLGPAPSDAQRAEVAAIQRTTLVWLDQPLDWMAEDEQALAAVPEALARLARERQVDLVHLNLPSHAAQLRPLLPEGTGLVVASHSCLATWWEAVKGTSLPEAWQWHRERERRGLAAADAVLVPSRSHGEALTRIYGRIGRLRVVHNATSPAAPAEKRPFVMAAARWWDEGKNAALLNEVARRVEWPVVAAGAIEEGQGQRVRMPHVETLGEVPHAEATRLLAEAAILVSPSLYEPFGLVALEAASRGAALILSDIPTYRELWSEAAVLAPPRDAQAFAAAVSRVATDGALRADLSRRALERAARFRPDLQVAQVLDAYAAAGAIHPLAVSM
ncbi:glycosyltransferase family 4 protein [Roseitranquillus sediminis]|uniref:glycosyltransferase family 4 protein n=1 Tax=Roseitranquillus sediminis TaxID=2809051 RepID=UPI001D0CB468|nr:glycosyltransferase family 4 protein [Roseitranquillus sediminis]MBM9593376.1 glycosyltransferase family 4 protein [Roseitranquillus sediminis]